MIVDLIDGTYELFRHFHGLRRFRPAAVAQLGAVAGVLGTVLQMIEAGSTHLGVATDHVIESFRNQLWSGYKTGEGVDQDLLAQFEPLEQALNALGVVTWPMIDLEADDALASAAAQAAADPRVAQVRIWTPDKDLAQCVLAERVVQIDRRTGNVRSAESVWARFGVGPDHIPDYLALVGDSADGYPGIAGVGPKGAAQLIARHGAIEQFPESVLGERRALALLFKRLATLRTDAALFTDVEALRWRGPTPLLESWATRLGNQRLLERARNLAAAQSAARS